MHAFSHPAPARHDARMRLSAAAMPASTPAPSLVTQQGTRGTAAAFEPQRVLLFSGHMVDAPQRAVPRFPGTKVERAADAIAAVLDTLGAGAGDLALTQGAAGGDILFAEDCLARGVEVQLLLPLPEPEFVARSVLPSQNGAAWQQRWQALRARLPQAPLVLREDTSASAQRLDAFERCNLWLLASALAYGADKLHFICLWDGGGGDGPGGTAHMVGEVQRLAGCVHWLDTRQL